MKRSSQTQFSYLSFVSDFFTQEKQANIPDHVLYDKLFRMVVSLKKKAESEETSAEERIGLTNFFRNRANLTPEENQILQNISLEHIQQVTPIDAQAKIIIAQARAANPNGVVHRNQPPPVELVNLQKRRDEMALRHRNRLKESLGADGFAKFDKYIREDFASRIQAIPLSSINFDQKQ
ncbi:MAG TPA: hypothetical protein VK892_00580 [Pyrinomonadaceae bacterium]|nr:hypothetical protein [Pyrinomonadaceae bacterium]